MSGNLNLNSFQRLDDANLVARGQTRDAAAILAFSVLVERHRGSLLRRCQACLGNRHDAEDALQETLLRAYCGLGGFRGESSVRTWLIAIADNQCYSLAQRRARHIIGEHLRGLIELHERQRAPVAGDDRLPGLQRALAAVPRRDREILHLRFFQDRALEEIAGILGIGLSAAKMRLYRAIERLGYCLDHAANMKSV